MSTSYNPYLSGSRVPLRLRMSPRPGRDRLDGGWWPQTRNLAVELADLVNHFPQPAGRIMRAVVSPPDWDTPPRSVLVTNGYVEVVPSTRNGQNVIHLRTADRTVLVLLVVPPGTARPEAEDALRTASMPAAASALPADADAPEPAGAYEQPRARLRPTIVRA
jgi:Family of unknown function (DUF5994)